MIAETTNSQNFNFIQQVQSYTTKTLLIKIGFIITGILLISGAVAVHCLGVNVITSYVYRGCWWYIDHRHMPDELYSVS